MQALSRENLAGNAFRVLGLPAAAKQVEVDAAARRLRIWADPAQVPATPWDAPWLGPLPRNRVAIEQAVARLSDPVSRIRQRLFWFADGETARQTLGSIRSLGPRAQGGVPRDSQHPCIAHDTGLARLASALIADPEMKSPWRWESAVMGFCRAVRTEAYQEWFLAVERAGDFEKRAGHDEVLASFSGLSTSIVESLGTHARDALDRDRADTCLQWVGLLRSASAGPDVVNKVETGICDRIEDLLAVRCERLRDDLFKNFNWALGPGHWRAGGNRSKCRSADRQLKSSIDPLFGALSSMEAMTGSAMSAADRKMRLGLPAARMLRNLGLAWGRVGQRKKARITFLRARQMTDDREMTQKLDTDLADLEKQKNKPATAGSRRGWAIVAVIVGLIRLLANLPGETRSRPSEPPNYREPKRELEMQDRTNQPWTPVPSRPSPGLGWEAFFHPASTEPSSGNGMFQPAMFPSPGTFAWPTTLPFDETHSLKDLFRRPPPTEPASYDGTAPEPSSPWTTPAGGP